MMTTLFAAAAILGAQEAPTQWKGPDLVSRMLTTYHNRRSADGTITLTLRMGNESSRLITDVTYLMPSRLHIFQRSERPPIRRSIIVSDGRNFMYSRPNISRWEDIKEYLFEPVQAADGRLQLVGDIYAAGTASMLDRSIPLDIVINRRADLEYLRMRLANLTYAGRAKLGNEEMHRVTGLLRLIPGEKPTDPCIFWIDDNFMLRRFEVSEKHEDKETRRTLSFVLQWDLNITLDEVDKIDRNRFTIRR